MPKPTELKRGLPKILLYGPPGTGKTSLVMTLGDKLQLLTTDVGGWGPAMSFKDNLMESRKNVEVTECYEDVGRPGSGLQKVKSALFKISDEIAAGKYKYSAVCLDNLTSLGDQAMRMVLHNSGKMDHGAVMTSARSTGIEIQHWGIAMVEVENCLAMLKGFPLLVVVIAHDTSEEIDGITKKMISVIGSKLAPKVPSYFDEVWYTQAVLGAGGVTKHVIQTKMTASIMARSRDSVVDQTLLSDGMPLILERMGYKL